MNKIKLNVGIALIALLAACSGGGTSSDGPKLDTPNTDTSSSDQDNAPMNMVVDGNDRLISRADGNGRLRVEGTGTTINGARQYATLTIDGQSSTPLSLAAGENEIISVPLPNGGFYAWGIGSDVSVIEGPSTSGQFTGRYAESHSGGYRNGPAVINVDFDSGSMNVDGPESLRGVDLTYDDSGVYEHDSSSLEAGGVVFDDDTAGGYYSNFETDTSGIFLGEK